MERAQLRMRLGRFAEALPDVERCTALTPRESAAWLDLALVNLHLEHEAAYRSACREMLKRFGETRQPDAAARTAAACLLAAEPVAERPVLSRLTSVGLPLNDTSPKPPVLAFVRPLMMYHAANYRAALQGINAVHSTASVYVEPIRGMLLAMCNHRLNLSPMASRWMRVYAQTVLPPARFPRPGEDDLLDPESYMTMAILHREAARLVAETSQSGATQPTASPPH